MVASYIVSVKTIYPHNQSLPYSLPALISPLKSCYHAISIKLMLIRHLPIANPFHRRVSHVALLVNNIFSLILHSRVQTPGADTGFLKGGVTKK